MKPLQLALAIVLVVLGAVAPARSETWVFAAAACPPWKDIPGQPEVSKRMRGACQKDVDLFVSGARAAFDVTDDHVIALVDSQATGQGVRQALEDLARRAAPEDRVILYVNTHGGKVEALYKGYEVKDEIFAWYTTQEPQDFKAATARGDWMTARAFRDLVNGIMAQEIVTIIEACHSNAALRDYIDNVSDGIGGRGLDWPGREAVIFSSHEEQIANFTPDGTAALFTSILSDELQAGGHDSFFEAFERARLRTHRSARKACTDAGYSHADLLKNWKSYREMCTQMPTAWDPFGLLDDMGFVQDEYRHDG